MNRWVEAKSVDYFLFLDLFHLLSDLLWLSCILVPAKKRMMNLVLSSALTPASQRLSTPIWLHPHHARGSESDSPWRSISPSASAPKSRTLSTDPLSASTVGRRTNARIRQLPARWRMRRGSRRDSCPTARLRTRRTRRTRSRMWWRRRRKNRRRKTIENIPKMPNKMMDIEMRRKKSSESGWWSWKRRCDLLKAMMMMLSLSTPWWRVYQWKVA